MEIERFIKATIEEDVQGGDHTSLACVPSDKSSKAVMIAKESGIIAGIEISKTVFRLIDDSLTAEYYTNDGDSVETGKKIMEMSGKAQSILKAERLALNFMQRMSGIATMTNRFVKAVEGYPAKILDTRKTTPMFRQFEKMAVQIGGGENHRFGLWDMIMIKDNHIVYAGGIRQAISAVKDYLRKNSLNLKIEIETSSIEEINEVMTAGGVQRIMLDNFNVNEMEKAVRIINGRYETEASGGIMLNNVREYAATGVDFISVGALTHSYKSLDLSLKAL